MEEIHRILSERLERCYSGAVYDVLRAMGHPNQVLPHHIRPLELDQKLAGPVFTLSGDYDVHFDPHDTLLSWTAFLSKVPSETVVICQPNDRSLSHMGELSAETLQGKGVRGYIVDGGCRDSAFIREIGFKVFCSYLTPVDIVGRWKAGDLGEPIIIGEVKIITGDFVLADQDGIVIIPRSIVEEVVNRTEEVLETESLVRKAILAGMDPQEAYLKYGSSILYN